jgi:ribonucleoside-diphosphate reductase alpha chain
MGNEAIKNATSILDYVFRELAISYLARHDLAHVQPEDMASTTIGRGVEAEKPAPAPVSNGFVRGQGARFRLLDNGAAKNEGEPKGSQGSGAKAVQSGLVAAISSAKTTGGGPSGSGGGTTTALKRAPQPGTSEEPAGYAANAPQTQEQPEVEAQAASSPAAEEKETTAPDTNALRAEARMKGYEGEACGECGNFTMVRNGTCLKCDTCGATSGCS